MNNENQMPELPKVNEDEIKQEEVIDIPTEQNIPVEENKEVEINKVVEEVKETAKKEIEISGKFFKDLKSYLTTKDSSELFSLLWRAVIIVGLIVIIYFPFQLIIDLGANIFTLIGIEYTTRLASIWSSICNIVYGVLALVLFYLICKDRFYKLVKKDE